MSSDGLPATPSTFGECIKKTRLAKGMTQGELACSLGVGDQTVSNWERYETVPLRNTGKIERVCEVLGLDNGEMVGKYPWNGAQH